MRYLFTEFCGIGDLIQITPIIQTVSNLDAQSEIYLIGDNRWGALEVVKNSKLISSCYNTTDVCGENSDRVIDAKKISRLYRNNKKVIKRTSKKWINDIQFDVVFQTLESDLPDVIEQVIQSSNAKCFVRHIDTSDTANGASWGWHLARRKIPRCIDVPYISDRHDIDSNYDLLDRYMDRCCVRSYKTWIDVGEDDETLVKYKLIDGKYICIQPGAANGQPTPKTWHPENFLSLCEKVRIAFPSYKVVSVGDRGDFETTIQRYKWSGNVVNTAGETNLGELCQIIRYAQCVVVHDSGIMHIANALGANVVALYGPTNYRATKPLGEKSKVIFSKNEAFLVMHRNSKSEEDLAKEYPDHSAMAGISVETVFEEISAIIER